ncbi:OLC1v1037579C1 [Oldenlandia corymbosa var. corymbosa]|uniref:OLC1v1037579C1 n=1 Tax=Oldenlandia corymbosa var. corymbosa TaxID=529605 RepID=A0AAV1D0U9_OLDCO|nr:OLC1v1037579C1 [Oldenlandia corymbosa var. corymbosa]
MDPQEQIFDRDIKGLKKNGGLCDPLHVQWVIMEAQNNGSETESMESSIGEDSGENSAESSSSSELEEDASSSPTSSTSPASEYGPLYELSDLMNQLPIKRGLSKHYQGKSQSFTSLANAASLEDLAKKIGPYSQRMKSCKSYAGFDGRKYGPKATIAKKPSRPSSFSSFLGSKSNFVGSFRHPISLQKHY